MQLLANASRLKSATELHHSCFDALVLNKRELPQYSDQNLLLATSSSSCFVEVASVATAWVASVYSLSCRSRNGLVASIRRASD